MRHSYEEKIVHNDTTTNYEADVDDLTSLSESNTDLSGKHSSRRSSGSRYSTLRDPEIHRRKFSEFSFESGQEGPLSTRNNHYENVENVRDLAQEPVHYDGPVKAVSMQPRDNYQTKSIILTESDNESDLILGDSKDFRSRSKMSTYTHPLGIRNLQDETEMQHAESSVSKRTVNESTELGANSREIVSTAGQNTPNSVHSVARSEMTAPLKTEQNVDAYNTNNTYVPITSPSRASVISNRQNEVSLHEEVVRETTQTPMIQSERANIQQESHIQEERTQETATNWNDTTKHDASRDPYESSREIAHDSYHPSHDALEDSYRNAIEQHETSTIQRIQSVEQTTSQYINRILEKLQSQDIKRTARDTEILTGIAQIAAEMRNGLDEVRQMILEENQFNLNEINRTFSSEINKLRGPRPMQVPSPIPRTANATKRNIFTRAFDGIKSNKDLDRIEGMLLDLLDQVEHLDRKIDSKSNSTVRHSRRMHGSRPASIQSGRSTKQVLENNEASNFHGYRTQSAINKATGSPLDNI
ncbi:hypothetical protein V1511DRAFT_503476, partial [Dipodascopsis uninucleata]